jgi:DNA-binding HxlR family transcriptional regulator
VRDILFMKRLRFGDLLASPEKIPTNILTDRLRRLVDAGVLEKRVYQLRPTRHEYHLTEKGGALFDVLAAMVRWGREHLDDVIQLPDELLAQLDPRARQAAQVAVSTRPSG